MCNRGVMLLLLTAVGGASAQDPGNSTRRYSATITAWAAKTPPSGHVSVTKINGPVVIQGHDRDSVFVMLSGFPSNPATDGGGERPSGYSIRQTPGGYEIILPEAADATVGAIQIRVPRSMKQVTINLTGMGNIRVHDYDGEVSIDSRGGDVLLSHTTGVAFITSRDGEIRAVVDRLPAAGSGGLQFSANNGNIILTLPSDLRATLRLEANRGSIYSEFLPNQFQIDRTTIAGGIKGSSTIAGPGQFTDVQWTTGPGGTRMDLNPIIISAVGLRRGEAGVNVRATTINGSVIVTKGGPSVPPK